MGMWSAIFSGNTVSLVSIFDRIIVACRGLLAHCTGEVLANFLIKKQTLCTSSAFLCVHHFCNTFLTSLDTCYRTLRSQAIYRATILDVRTWPWFWTLPKLNWLNLISLSSNLLLAIEFAKFWRLTHFQISLKEWWGKELEPLFHWERNLPCLQQWTTHENRRRFSP